MADKTVRLQKFLADSGVASRRKSEELIILGKVKVNGVKAEIGSKVNPYSDTIAVAGKKINIEKSKRYIMLHKPRGFLTTMNDEQNRKCVASLIEGIQERIYPVGRLDKESEGLILLTNDGEFANLLMHPKQHVPKAYRVTVRPAVNDEQISSLCKGIKLDGKMTAPADVWVIDREPNRVVLEFILYEGKNRQIRRMCEIVGLEVARLKRTAVGEVKLGMLPPGKWRDLTETEVRDLYSFAKRENAAKKIN